MNSSSKKLFNVNINIYSLNTIIVGSGAAGLNAALQLHSHGQKDIAIVTEGLNMGTSRNTGSDKQTYYKLTTSGDESDSPLEMAKTLFNGGSMHGDIALIESATSLRSFFNLVNIGVPFPHNRYGEHIGYKTDHDPKQRATSAGPLTSKFMTEKLLNQVTEKHIQIFDGFQAIGILHDEQRSKVFGLIAINLAELNNPNKRYVLFNSKNTIYATGGPAGMYKSSVYPESQTGASGIALEAGAKAQNLTESQFGIASTKFRWNLSGTYQQVLPRYLSTNADQNDQKEFLNEYFEDPGKMLDAIFLKGYQWPFDARKITNFGSSIIDILVYYETIIKKRKVYLDYTHNPSCGAVQGELDFSLLGPESKIYLIKSGALFGNPVERLAHMNQPAIDLFRNNGIDLHKDLIEIGVCAQHCNGGLQGNIWWESNLKNFFPIGEVNGSHGVYRPGGTSLNSGQVGGIRAAYYINSKYSTNPPRIDVFLDQCKNSIEHKISLGEEFLSGLGQNSNALNIRNAIGERMDRCGGIIRNLDSVRQGKSEAEKVLNHLAEKTKISSVNELPFCFQNHDLLISQLVYLSSIESYIEKGGSSRGSYLIKDDKGRLPVDLLSELFRSSINEKDLTAKIQVVKYKDKRCKFEWESVRPIPEDDYWFETAWGDYLNDNILN